MLWICVDVSTHWARNFLPKIVKQRFDIHVFFTKNWAHARPNQLFSKLNSKHWCLETLFFLAILGIDYLLRQQVLCINQSQNLVTQETLKCHEKRENHRKETTNGHLTKEGFEEREWISILLAKFSLSFIDRGFLCSTVLNKIYFRA